GAERNPTACGEHDGHLLSRPGGVVDDERGAVKRRVVGTEACRRGDACGRGSARAALERDLACRGIRRAAAVVTQRERGGGHQDEGAAGQRRAGRGARGRAGRGDARCAGRRRRGGALQGGRGRARRGGRCGRRVAGRGRGAAGGRRGGALNRGRRGGG